MTGSMVIAWFFAGMFLSVARGGLERVLLSFHFRKEED